MFLSTGFGSGGSTSSSSGRRCRFPRAMERVGMSLEPNVPSGLPAPHPHRTGPVAASHLSPYPRSPSVCYYYYYYYCHQSEGLGAYRNRGESLMHSSNSTVILAVRSSAEEAQRPAAAQRGAARHGAAPAPTTARRAGQGRDRLEARGGELNCRCSQLL